MDNDIYVRYGCSTNRALRGFADTWLAKEKAAKVS